MDLVEELKARAAEYEAAAKQLRTTADIMERLGGAQQSQGGFSGLVERSEPAIQIDSGVKAVKAILGQSGTTPLSKKDIADQLMKRGIVLTDSTLMTYLSRYEFFKSLGRDKWILTVNYDAAMKEMSKKIASALIDDPAPHATNS